MAKIFRKTVDEVLDYKGKYADWLDGDTIAASEWEVPSDITKDSDSFTDTEVTIWFSGGESGVKYKFVNLITTAAGRKKQVENYITIRDIGL